jgi:hypothetical protein
MSAVTLPRKPVAEPVARLAARSVYGSWVYYPMNDVARALCDLLGRKSIEPRHWSAVRELGFDIAVEGATPAAVVEYVAKVLGSPS